MKDAVVELWVGCKVGLLTGPGLGCLGGWQLLSCCHPQAASLKLPSKFLESPYKELAGCWVSFPYTVSVVDFMQE